MSKSNATGYSELGTLGIETFGRRLGVMVLETITRETPVVVFGPSALAQVRGAQYLWWQANARVVDIEALRPMMASAETNPTRLTRGAPKLELHCVYLDDGPVAPAVSCFLPRNEVCRHAWSELTRSHAMSVLRSEVNQYMSEHRRQTREIRRRSLLPEFDKEPLPPPQRVNPAPQGAGVQSAIAKPRVHSSPPSSSSFEAAER